MRWTLTYASTTSAGPVVYRRRYQIAYHTPSKTQFAGTFFGKFAERLRAVEIDHLFDEVVYLFKELLPW
jgi:hypothetical protein